MNIFLRLTNKLDSVFVGQLKTTQGITEQLKVDNPMEWIEKMNCIR